MFTRTRLAEVVDALMSIATSAALRSAGRPGPQPVGRSGHIRSSNTSAGDKPLQAGAPALRDGVRLGLDRSQPGKFSLHLHAI